MFHVEKMEVADFPFAVQLANTMNWNMTVEDFEFNVKLEPRGCFVQFHGQERIGIATSIAFGKVGWFGNFIVKENFRGEGAGSILIKHAIDYLKDNGVETIGLNAYPHLVKFYESFGFEVDIDFVVLHGKNFFPETQERLRAVRKLEIPKVIDLDCRCFGANRRELLEHIFRDSANLCFVTTEDNEVTGFVAEKISNKMAEVGPLICKVNRVKDAVLLLETALSQMRGFDVFMYIPKKEIELLNVLYGAGLKEAFRVVRMFMGPHVANNCIYTAESLERG